MLKTLCNLKEISVYRCSKDTNIPYSTLSDIANHKTDPNNINALILKRLAEYFSLSMDDLYTILNLKQRLPFSSFRSEMCHKLHRNGDIEMLSFIRKNNYIPILWNIRWYPEALYTLAMFDEITEKNNASLCMDYEQYRKTKMKELIVSPDIILMEKLTGKDDERQKLIANANPYFLQYNILEGDIYAE